MCSYLGNRTRGGEVGRSWASPPSEFSRTALWCPGAVQEEESINQEQGKYSAKGRTDIPTTFSSVAMTSASF